MAACLRSQLSTGSSHDWNHALAEPAAIFFRAPLARAAFGTRMADFWGAKCGRAARSLILFSVTAPHSNTVQSLYCKMNDTTEGSESGAGGDRGAEGHRDAFGHGVSPTCFLLPTQVLPH